MIYKTLVESFQKENITNVTYYIINEYQGKYNNVKDLDIIEQNIDKMVC